MRPSCQALVGGLFLLLGCGATMALDFGDTVQIHGFASQAFTMTNHNNLFGQSSDGSLGYTELGLNGSWRPLPSLQFSAQALSRRAGEVDDGGLRLDYGFVDFTALSDQDRRWGIRIGRVKNPYGLYNETRDVAFTRPSIFLPQSIYFDQVRPLIISSDGVNIYGEERTGYGDFFLQMSAVRLDADNRDTELAFFGVDAPGHFDNDISYFGQLLYEYDAGTIRAAISGVRGTMDYKSGARDFFQDGSVRISPIILSFQYNAEKWSFTTEYWIEGINYTDLGPAFPDLSINAESYYLQGAYRFHPEWEVFVRYDAFFRDKNDKNGDDFEAATGQPHFRGFAKDWTTGLRWDITPSVMVRVEYHRIDGTGWLPLQDNPDQAEWTRRWNLFALQVSARF